VIVAGAVTSARCYQATGSAVAEVDDPGGPGIEIPRTGITDADCNDRISDLLNGENDVAISVDMSRRF
jgi:hypothetical protein